jgi:hypothetical protein
MWCGKDDTTGEKISGMCEECKTKRQPETLPNKLARLIRENPGMPVEVVTKGFCFRTNKINEVHLYKGTIWITIGTP